MNQEVPYLPKNSKWSSSKNYLPVLTFCNDQYLTLKEQRNISNVWNQASSNVKNFIQTKCKENKKEEKKTNRSNEVPTVPLYYYYPTYHRPKSYLSQLEIMSQMYKKKIKNVNNLKNTIANEVSIRNEAVMKHIEMLKNLKNEQNNDHELFQKGLSILYDSYHKEKKIARTHKNLEKNKNKVKILELSTFKNSKPKKTKKRTIFTMTDAVRSSTSSDKCVKIDNIKLKRSKTSAFSSKTPSSIKSSKSLSDKITSEGINEENILKNVSSTSFISHTQVPIFKTYYERSCCLKNNKCSNSKKKKRTIFTIKDAVSSSSSDKSVKINNIKLRQSKTKVFSGNTPNKIIFSKSLSDKITSEGINEENILKNVSSTSFKSHTQVPTFKSHYERSYLKDNEFDSKPLLLTSEKATKFKETLSISKCSKYTKITESCPVEKNIFKNLLSKEDKLLKPKKYKNDQVCKLPSVSSSMSLKETKTVSSKIDKNPFISLPRIDLKKCQNWVDSQSPKIGFSNQIREVENILSSESEKNVFEEKLKKCEIRPEIRKNYGSNFIKNIKAKTKVGRYRFNNNKYNSDTNNFDIPVKNEVKHNIVSVEKCVKPSKTILPIIRSKLPDIKQQTMDITAERSFKNLNKMNAMREQIELELSQRVNMVCQTGFFPPLNCSSNFVKKSKVLEKSDQKIAVPILDFDSNSSKSIEIDVKSMEIPEFGQHEVMVKVQKQLIDGVEIRKDFEPGMTKYLNSSFEEIEDMTHSDKKSNFDISKTEDELSAEIKTLENQDISRSDNSLSVVDSKHEITVISKIDSIIEDFQEINDSCIDCIDDIKEKTDEVTTIKAHIATEARSENHNFQESRVSYGLDRSFSTGIQQTNVTNFVAIKNKTETILEETILEDFHNDEDYSEIEDQCATPDISISEESNVEFGNDDGNCKEYVEEFEEAQEDLDVNKHRIVESGIHVFDENREFTKENSADFVKRDYKDNVVSHESLDSGETVSFSSDDEINCEQSIDTQAETQQEKYFGQNVIIIFKATEDEAETYEEAIDDPNLGCDYYNFEKINIMPTLSEGIVNFYEVRYGEVTVDIGNKDTHINQGAEDKALTVDAETENPILDFDQNNETSTDATTETDPINDQSIRSSINNITFNQSDIYKTGIMINLKIHLPPKLEDINIVPEIKTIIEAQLEINEHNIKNKIISGSSITGYELLETTINNMIKDAHEYDPNNDWEQSQKESCDITREVILSQDMEDVRNKDISENDGLSMETGYKSQSVEIEHEKIDQSNTDLQSDSSEEKHESLIESLSGDIENSDQYEDSDVSQEVNEKSGSTGNGSEVINLAQNPKCIKEEQIVEEDELPTEGPTNNVNTEDITIESEEETNDINDYVDITEEYENNEISEHDSVNSTANLQDMKGYPGVFPADVTNEYSITESVMISEQFVTEPTKNEAYDQVVKDIVLENSNIVDLEQNNAVYAESEEETRTIVSLSGMLQSQIQKCSENPKSVDEENVLEYSEDIKSKEICPQTSIYNTTLQEFFANLSADDFSKVFPVNTLYPNWNDEKLNFEGTDNKGLYDTVLYELFSNLSPEDFTKTFPVNTEYLKNCDDQEIESKEISKSLYDVIMRKFFSNPAQETTEQELEAENASIEEEIDALTQEIPNRSDEKVKKETEYFEGTEFQQTKSIYDVILRKFFSNPAQVTTEQTLDVIRNNKVLESKNAEDEIDASTHQDILKPIDGLEEQDVDKVAEYLKNTKGEEISLPKNIYDAVLGEFYSHLVQETTRQEQDNIRDTNKWELDNAFKEDMEVLTHQVILKPINGLEEQDVDKVAEYLEDRKSKEISLRKSIYDAVLREFSSNPVLLEGTKKELDRSGSSTDQEIDENIPYTIEHNASTQEEIVESEDSSNGNGNASTEPKFIPEIKEYIQDKDIMHLRPKIEELCDKHQTDLNEKTTNGIWERLDSSTSEEDTTSTTDREQKEINQYENMTPIFIFGQKLKDENVEIAPMKKRRIESRAGPWGDTMLSITQMPLVKNKTIQNIKLPPLNSSHTLPKIKPKSFAKYKRGNFFPTKVKLVEKVKRSHFYKDETAIEEEKNILSKILESEINTSLRMARCSMNAAANLKFFHT